MASSVLITTHHCTALAAACERGFWMPIPLSTDQAFELSHLIVLTPGLTAIEEVGVISDLEPGARTSRWRVGAAAVPTDDTALARWRGAAVDANGPIARCYAQMRAAELMVHHAARVYDEGGNPGEEANMAKLLASAGKGRGLISICAAGGQGVVAILER